jgi:Raf kinase inhibitor-like YbhB/YbcL family protein
MALLSALTSLVAAFVLSSNAFSAGHAMPTRLTCDGSDVSPPLRWTAPPRGTRAFTLRLVDLDTQPQFVHWYVTALSPRLRGLAAASRAGRQHANSFGHVGYGGPCPPAGQTHRYVFQLYALGARGRVLAHARLLTTYRR